MSEGPQDQGLATEADLFGSKKKRRYRGGDVDPGDRLVLPVEGKRVRIRSLTEGEFTAYDNAIVGTRGQLRAERLQDAARRLIVLCLVDAAGNRLLGPGHVARLKGWDSADVQYLYRECVAHVGSSTEDIEETIKNSEGAPAD